MYSILLFLTMVFCHIVDDYYLQGFLASAKQRSWWEKNAPEPLYRYDFIIALLEHAFSWTFMVHLPVFVLMVYLNNPITTTELVTGFLITWLFHAFVDHMKANVKSINLVMDQTLHLVQIWIIFTIYANHFGWL